MNLWVLLLLAVVTLGRATYRPLEKPPCEMVDMEVLCHSRGLLQIPAVLHADSKALDLSQNQLQSILETPLIFYTALRRLDLSSNQISFIQPGIFTSLPQLEYLNLARNRLGRASPQNGNGGIGRLPHVATLDLSGNGLYNGLAEAFLEDAPDLLSLSLAENSLTRISRWTLQGVPALEELDLHSNVIMEIEEGAFDDLPRLTRLNLSMNSITCISDFSLPQLRFLDLSRNSIETFQTAPSDQEYQLHWLDLHENKLSQFPDLPRHNQLVYLNVSNNLIQMRPTSSLGDRGPGTEAWAKEPTDPSANDSSSALAHLLFLDLSYNEIESIPQGFLDPMTSLQFLNLSRNCLRTFEAKWERALPSLDTLDVSHNDLQGFAVGLRGLASLRQLFLQHNALTALPPLTLASLPKIQRVDLHRNWVRPCGAPRALVEPAASGCLALSNIPSLRALNLAGNALQRLPEGTFLQTPLVTLDLSANPGLEVVPGALAGLEASLEVLQLQGNGLDALHVDLPRFTRLKQLNLSENQLSWLPAWTREASLEKLDLRNNSFSHLESRGMSGLEGSLRRLYLAGNPLACCGNGWLAAVIQRGSVDIANLEQLMCRHSKDFSSQEDVPFLHVRPEDCEKEGLKKINVLILLIVVLVLSVLLIGVALFCCFCRQEFNQHFKA
ncbi:transforming growth factor beta activator LRRC32 [Sarcophilus harrisii]|uniref:Leucine rich repeat containing 32 n=1 Tax=Sarcophilus harrisii TaxID=9305 RepID=G3VZM0_SARHA|nr:transforming growth factor beta activator LRRC32 [Sarcophilus harrisii]XP_023355457.1 transforming growth factor beta activator LRRC32 [Sarcophilus harrisii]XP_031817210.1 transforming growth factor beta activator LRRC32 [Sarcophilus harrisii]